MDLLIAQFVSGLASATLLFLLASGFSLIFGVSRILNLAHGALFALAGYLAFTTSQLVSASAVWFWIMLVVVPPAMMIVGLVVERSLLRRIYPAGIDAQVLLTVGLIYVINDLIRLIWGTGYKSVHIPAEFSGRIAVAGVEFSVYQLVVVAFGVVVAAGLLLAIHRTRWGLLIRAAAEDRQMSSALGVNEPRLFALVFAVGCGLVGLAAVLTSPLLTVDLELGTGILVEALVVVIVGGLGSIGGAAVAAIIIGMIKAFGILVAPQFDIVFVVGFMALVLLVRPAGLFGSVE
jgi:branched-subunit amino acid ABC-type transport system permease component